MFAVALVTTLFLAPGWKARALFLASFLGLMIALAAESPLRFVGDAGEYLVMAVNLGRLSPPSLSAAELAEAKRFVPDDAGVRLERPRLKAPDGRQDFPHFWLYSLAAAPLVGSAQAAGANPLAGFRLLNIALIFGLAALLAARASPSIALFVAAGPAIWWVDKAHTEVFTSVMLASALVLLRSAPWWSILALGGASAQNPAIGGALLVAIGYAVYERRRDWRVWTAAAAAMAGAALHPLYFQWRLGTWTGLYDAIDRHWPSFRELTTAAFDPNLGIFINDPVLLLALAIAIVEALTRPGRKPFDAGDGAVALMALFFLISFTQTTNVNSGGTPGPSRYGLWLVPFAVPLLSGIRADAVWLRVLAGGSVVWCVWAFAPELPEQYLRPSTFASDVWRRWPGLDNPIAEVFAERTAGREPARLPSATDGCEKILLMGDGSGAAWPTRCTAATPPPFCRSNGAVCYANKTADGYRFVAAVWTPAWLANMAREGTPQPTGMLVITQATEPQVPMAIWHGEGWSYPEQLPEPTQDVLSREWRWIEGRARVGVMASQPVGGRLKIVARSLNRMRRLKISIGAVEEVEIVTLAVAESHSEYQTPEFELPAGTNLITFESLDEGEAPASGDPRRLSVAVFRIELVATKR